MLSTGDIVMGKERKTQRQLISTDLVLEFALEPCGKKSVILDDGEDRVYVYPNDIPSLITALVHSMVQECKSDDV